MDYKTVTKQELSNSINEKLGYSKEESKKFINFILDKISTQLVKGDTIKLSSLGTLSIKNKNERIGRNPKTGEKAIISSRKVVVFKSSVKLRDKLNLD